MTGFDSSAEARHANPASASSASAPRGDASIREYRGAFRRALSVGIFPFTMVVFVGGGLFALRHGLRPELLSPVFVVPFLIWIAAFERLHAYCPAWNQDHGDLRTDLVHLVVSGMLTPQVAIWLLNMSLLPLGAALAARFVWFGWP